MRNWIVAVLIVFVASVASAQEPSPAWNTDGERHVADVISTSTVAASIAFDTWHSFRADNRKVAFEQQALRMGATVLTTEVLKRVIHRRRPDGSDNYSFPSEHTALAVASTGWRFQVSFPLSLGSGYLRTAAAKHYPTDVLAGAGIGALFMRIWP